MKDPQTHKHLGDMLLDGAISAWVYITLGLVTLLGFMGKRTIARIDEVTKSHMPSHIIDGKIEKIYEDMAKCQQDIVKSVEKVHGRIDDVYNLIATQHPPNEKMYRKERRDD